MGIEGLLRQVRLMVWGRAEDLRLLIRLYGAVDVGESMQNLRL